MNSRILQHGVLMMALGTLLIGCDSDDENNGNSGAMGQLQLSLSGLEPLGGGMHYEGWAIIRGQPVTTGKFNLDATGGLVNLDGQPLENGVFETAEELGGVEAVVISIEPAGDSDPAPADTKVLGGAVYGSTAQLSVAHAAALGDNYSGAAGDYVLATPTNGAGSDETSGVWFLDLATTITVDFVGLEPLMNGMHYEGWVIVDGMPLSTGKFNVSQGGGLEDLDGQPIPNGEFVIHRALDAATAFVLSIEPAGDTDPLPAATKLLGGDISDGMATLDVSHGAALGDDFSMVAGDYILATPTDGANTSETSGLWFLDLSSGTPDTGLELPLLPEGWVYEGWAVIDGTPVTTGRFTDPMAADFSAPYSGSEPGPPFPGEDFLVDAPVGLTFPTTLAGGAAVISIEPQPDDSPLPYTLKPLVGMIPGDVVDHVTYAMEQNPGSLVTGTVTLNTVPMAGLELPPLPAGWVYEGWAVIDGTPVTTGRFTDVTALDSSAPHSGSMPGPPFPGEDFLVNAPMGLSFPTDLSGAAFVISIEPEPDDSAAPFSLKPLIGTAPMQALDHATFMLENESAGFPGGTATVN